MNLNLLRIPAILVALSIITGPSILSDAQELVPHETEEDNVENSLRIMKKLRETRDGLGSLQQILHDIDDDLRHQQVSACAVSGGMSEHCLEELLFNQLNLDEWLAGGFSPGRRQISPLHDKTKRTSSSSHSTATVTTSGGGDSHHSSQGPEPPLSKRSEWNACPVGVSNPGFLCFTNKAVQRQHRTKFLQTTNSPGKRSATAAVNSPDKIGEILAAQFKSKINGFTRNSLGEINRKRKGLEILKRILSEMDSDLLTQQKRTCKLNLGGHCATESAAAAADQWMFLQSPYSPGRRRRDTSLFLRKLTEGQD